MELSERKALILQAIIHDYIETAEPVGSRHISKSYNLGLSSATIRNEMADLEDLGYIQQPHTSSGRVPSDLGYRLYVNELMDKYRFNFKEIEVMKQILEIKTNQLDKLVMHISKAISHLTNYTAIAVTPEINKCSIKKIDIISIDNNQIIIVLVTDSGIVKNKMLKLYISVESEYCVRLSNILNDKLAGLTIGAITPLTIKEIESEIKVYLDVLAAVLDCIYVMISEVDNREVYLGGVSNILGFPEYRDNQKSKQLLRFIENKDNLINVLSDNKNESLITISIGKENGSEIMHDCSIVVSNYRIFDNIVGQIGVIGPTRMDYSKLVPFMEQISANLSVMLEDQFYDQKDR